MEKAKICKHNMKLYPIYHTLSFDFLFFYTINVLFLTQVKHISPSEILLVDAFYSLFGIFFQIPASIILDKTSRKKSLILGNLLNCAYLVVIMLSKNIFHLIFAETLCAFGYALKDIASPSILNESIPITKRKSEIFAKLNGKALSGYYILNAISLAISGALYSINGYIPILLSLSIVVLAFLLSSCFIEPLELSDNKENKSKPQTNLKFKDSLKFIFSSGRLKSLILFSSVMAGLISILATSEVYLVEELEISSSIVGLTFAILGIISGIAAKKQNKFHEKFKNKALSILGLSISISCITATLGFFLNFPKLVTFLIILVSFAVRYIIVGIFNVLITKYLSNFTNEEIDSKIYSVTLLFNSICKTIFGILASIVLDLSNAYIAMFIYGITFLVLFILIIIYMKNRLGLKADEYSAEEIKYSKITESI